MVSNSFKFTQKPHFQPADQPPGKGVSKSESYKIGRLVGQIIIGLLGLFILFSAIKQVRKKASKSEDKVG